VFPGGAVAVEIDVKHAAAVWPRSRGPEHNVCEAITFDAGGVEAKA